MKNLDWTGNKRSTFSTLGASNHSDYEREERDFYATDSATILPLLNQLEKDDEKLNDKIWENAVGDGHLAKELKKHGYEVKSSDIIQRNYPCEIIDFLKISTPNSVNMDIVTNPPYKWAQDWVEKSLETIKDGYKVVMFLKLTFLEGQKRRKLFDKCPPKYVYVFSARQKCAMNGDFKNTGSSAACYAWIIFKRGFCGNTIIRWI